MGLIQIIVVLCGSQLVLLAGFVIGAKLIEEVEVTFSFGLTSDTISLQQVMLDLGTNNVTGSVEIDFYEFTETRGVVITRGLGITKGF